MPANVLQQEDGAIDAPKTVQDVRQEPYPLPDAYVITLPAGLPLLQTATLKRGMTAGLNGVKPVSMMLE